MTIKQALLTYYMDNPSLTNDVDYLPDEERLAHYTSWIESLSGDELTSEYQLLIDEGLI